MNVTSYRGQTFVVEDNDTRLRQASNLTKFEAYAASDVIPPGKAVGDLKRLPKRTEVRVTDIRIDGDRTVFALVEPVAADPRIPSGWTKASNLRGGLINEFLGTAPTATLTRVVDKEALIRSGPPRFGATEGVIPVDSLVLVTAMSKDGKFVKVSQGALTGGDLQVLDEIGWTAVTNLERGPDAFFATAEWLDDKGPNACWEAGSYTGARVLVNVGGTGGEMEQVPLDALAPYVGLLDMAAQRNLTLSINSAFRTFAQQAALFKAHKDDRSKPVAAEAGKSNHQHGQAFDLNTGGFDGTAIYDWLKENGPRLGFVRTVNGEHWHWEYRPDDAVRLAQDGRFALRNVTV